MSNQKQGRRGASRKNPERAEALPSGISAPAGASLLKKGQKIQAGDLALVGDDWREVTEDGDPWHPAIHWPVARMKGHVPDGSTRTRGPRRRSRPGRQSRRQSNGAQVSS